MQTSTHKKKEVLAIYALHTQRALSLNSTAAFGKADSTLNDEGNKPPEQQMPYNVLYMTGTNKCIIYSYHQTSY